MTVTFHALWMLGVLGAATFAAAAAPRRQWLTALTLGYVTAIWASGGARVPDAQVVGVVAAAGAIVFLFRPRHAWFAAALGGATAGTSSSLLSLVGVPSWVAIVLIAALMAGTVFLARTRPGFAPELLREDAMLVTGALGLIVAALPSLFDGWQAAEGLNARVDDKTARAIPIWTLSVVALSTLLGAAHALWSRR